MTTWKPDLSQADESLYLVIAQQLARDIESGKLSAGTRLPTHRALARSLQVNVGTITRAYAEAARRGLIDGEVGRGSYVRHPAARAFSAGQTSAIPEGVVDLAFNLPAGGPSAAERSQALVELSKSADLDALFTGYHLQGLANHCAAGARWISERGVPAAGERVLVTGGAQHALAVALATCAQPGDVVLAEALTYTGLKPLTRMLGQRLHPVAIDEHGLIPEAFEAACHGNAVKALYCQPTSHNPTAVTLDLGRRRSLVEIARRYDVALIEDDTYGFVGSNDLAPLAALAPESTYYVTSLSKSVSSGLRVGFLMPPSGAPQVLERAIAALTAIGWTAAPLVTELASRWIQDGTAARVAREKREEARARQALARRILGSLAAPSDPSSCHLWLHLPEPWRASDFVGRAHQAGVAVTPAEAFVIGRAVAPHAVRVCISTPRTRTELESGLHVLARLMRQAPAAQATVV
ncbi:MAG: PLP-dependent aminotransferase family protein [Planctomycetes bacterium]|nr:PLP-dependent aminotransferase family protein [Planctomycetota bacterium]